MRPSSHFSHNRFTLIEILAVVGIIALLFAMSLAGYALFRLKMNRSRTNILINQLEVGLENYNLEHGYYPQALEAKPFRMDKADTNPNFRDHIDYEALKSKIDTENDDTIRDHFNDYIWYQCPGSMRRSSFDLWSPGPDGTTGTEDDIDNWSGEDR